MLFIASGLEGDCRQGAKRTPTPSGLDSEGRARGQVFQDSLPSFRNGGADAGRGLRLDGFRQPWPPAVDAGSYRRPAPLGGQTAAPGDATELKEGMVLVLNPHVQGPGGTILYSRDTVLLDFNGCKILGWYKDWREPYIASDSYYSGGG